uniref:Uncharacterized protein n=1 Tax=Arundo donax TaxID=35708 RepID=A0A0A9FGE4_ARUDO
MSMAHSNFSTIVSKLCTYIFSTIVSKLCTYMHVNYEVTF